MGEKRNKELWEYTLILMFSNMDTRGGVMRRIFALPIAPFKFWKRSIEHNKKAASKFSFETAFTN